jgi:ABC-type transporter Mla subunit MlaD
VSGKPRPRLVGLFVIAAVLLLLGGLMAISSGGLFTPWRTWVVFLPGSATGLKEGSPVTMRGVQIGEVREVELFFTGRGHEVGIMVVIQVRRGSIKTLDGVARVASLSDAEVVRQQVAEGLRAEVKSSSPIAGQKSIALDFHPEREARFAGIKTPYPEVPTAASGMERLNEKIEETLKKISEIPIDEVVTQLRDTLQSAQLLLDSGDLRGAVTNLRITLATANQTLKRADRTMGSMDELVARTRTTMTTTNDTVKSLGAAVDNMNRTLATVDRNVERTAETQFEAAQTLDEMRELMKSLRYLVDTLQQHPESLLQGKPEPKEKK